MNKQKVLLVLGLSLLLSGCNLLGKKTNSVQQTNKEEAKQAEKLAKIIERGGKASCTVTETANKTNVTAMKISGKKMRIEGQSLGEGQKKGFMINDGVYSYIWSEGEKQGYKTKLPTEQELEDLEEKTENIKTETPEVKVDQYDDETKYKVECKEGSVTDNDFVPPTDVKFIDPAELMKGIPQGVPADVLKNLPQ